MKCDNCMCTDTYIKLYHHKFNIKNEVIEFDSDRRFCSQCNELVYDHKLDDIANKLSIKLYNERFGISKEAIIHLRKKYNMSQQQFSKVIGCAKKTLISYELGNSIPNDIYMITLKTLIDNPDIIFDIVDSNKDRFTEKEYTTILNKLDNIKIDLIDLFDKKPSIYNGFTSFSFEKLINLILLLSDNDILKTKLLIEMFYCDYYMYKTRGISLTGLEYIKLFNIICPKDFDYILNSLVDLKYVKYDVKYDKNYETYCVIKNKESNNKIFNKDEIKIIRNIKEYFNKFNLDEIINHLQNEKAFIENENLKRISFDYAFEIQLDNKWELFMRKNKFGIQLKEFLEFNKISSKEFSKSINISLEELNDILTGKLEITDRVIDRISNVTEIPKTYIESVESNYKLDNLINDYLKENNQTIYDFLNSINYKELAKKYSIKFTDERNYYWILKDIMKVVNIDIINKEDK